MPLGSGVRLGPYRIEAPIGAGGMGEVYRARDTRLDRTVAIKLLAADVAADPQFRERFDREARTISSLDHPHICTLFDIGHDDASGVDYLVMQHLEGQTLADRLAGGVPLPVEEALRCAIQTASALDAAHRAGVVHRDLKPANVMITKSGIKLLDFGVAKISAPRTAGVHGATIAVTQATPITEKGMLVGTIQYMSPEQLEGYDVDARSDIFSFGAVLYEMLTGRRAFDGTSLLKTALPSAAQRNLERLLQKCLARNPNDRWQSAADLADELRWIDQERARGEEADIAPLRSRIREWIWIGVATAVALVAVALLAREYRRPSPPPPQIVTLGFNAPDDEPFALGPGLLAMSPDGRRVVFLAGRPKRLWIRPLDALAAQPLPGTERADQPSWSPDSHFVLFIAGGLVGPLKKIDVATRQTTTIVEVASGRASWSPAGVILFHAPGGYLMQISDRGGETKPATELDLAEHETRHGWPFFLPDGRRFLYVAFTGDRSAALYLGSIDSKKRTKLFEMRSNVDYANGYILYAEDGRLMARPFDQQRGEAGPAVVVREHVEFNKDSGHAVFSASANGVLAYRTGVNVQLFDFAVYDRSGKFLRTVGDIAEYEMPAVSPDGERLAVARRDATGHTDVWILELDRDVSTPLTSDPADDENPVWSHDGQQVFFSSNRLGPRDLYVRQAGGTAREELLYASKDNKIPTGVSADGGLLLFSRVSNAKRRGGTSDIWALPLRGERTPFPVGATPTTGGHAVFSPDAHWIAYDSNDSRQDQVYVLPFPPNGSRIQLSTKNGVSPKWTMDGRHVVYGAFGGTLMSVGVTPSGGTLKPERPVELPIPSPGGPIGRLLTMSPNGESFLVPKYLSDDSQAPITVTLNWMSGLRK